MKSTCGCFIGTARDDHLPVSIPGFMILKISKLAMAILHANAYFRDRTRDSEAQLQIAAGSPWQIFGGPARRIRSAGSEIETLENHFVKNHFLMNISNYRCFQFVVVVVSIVN